MTKHQRLTASVLFAVLASVTIMDDAFDMEGAGHRARLYPEGTVAPAQ